MRMLAVALPSRCGTAFTRQPRHTARIAARFDFLEMRQLLSAGQSASVAAAVGAPSGPGNSVRDPSSDSGVAGVAGSSLGVNLSSLAPLNGIEANARASDLSRLGDAAIPSASELPTLASLGETPTTNQTEVNPSLSFLAVSWLNPLEASPMGSILDTQVDADAYLVPSTTDQLEEYLGERAAPGSERGSMFSDLDDPHARPIPPTMQLSTHNAAVSTVNAPGSASTVGFFRITLGQPAPNRSVIYPQSLTHDEFVGPIEPIEPVGPPQAPQHPPTPPGKQTPAPGDVSPTPRQAPAPGATPGTSQTPGQAPTPGTTPWNDQTPVPAPSPGTEPRTSRPAWQAPAPGARPKIPDAAPPQSDDAVFDAALDLMDVRAAIRSHDSDSSRPDDTASRADSSRIVSTLLGASVVAAGGFHLAMQNGRRLPRAYRIGPRWF
jgi:hypothetical protein